MSRRRLSAFKVRVGNRFLDYRLGIRLDLREAGNFFGKNYKVERLWFGGRHVLGHLEKGSQRLFLKLATSEGMGVLVKNEQDWNREYSRLFPRNKSRFWAPKNVDWGLYRGKLFYLITDRFSGDLIINWPETSQAGKSFYDAIDEIIELSETIQNIKKANIVNLNVLGSADFREWFFEKTKTWFDDIPNEVIRPYKIGALLKLVKDEVSQLAEAPRHGDFTPWHILRIEDDKLGLIDGEHAMAASVENYDICYFIQRVFSVLKNPPAAEAIYRKLLERDYVAERLKIVLAARAIGGFLDESLAKVPDYRDASDFGDWVLDL